MRELTIDEVDEVSGGGPEVILGGILAAIGYLSALDYAAEFGSALGAGIYDGLHC